MKANITCLGIFLLLGIKGMAYATPMDAATRSGFIQSATSSCLDSAGKTQLPTGLMKSELNDYCACRATKMADDISLEKLLRFNRERNREIVQDDVDRSILYCNKKFSAKQGVSRNNAASQGSAYKDDPLKNPWLWKLTEICYDDYVKTFSAETYGRDILIMCGCAASVTTEKVSEADFKNVDKVIATMNLNEIACARKVPAFMEMALRYRARQK